MAKETKIPLSRWEEAAQEIIRRAQVYPVYQKLKTVSEGVQGILVDIANRHTMRSFHANRVSSDANEAIRLLKEALAEVEAAEAKE